MSRRITAADVTVKADAGTGDTRIFYDAVKGKQRIFYVTRNPKWDGTWWCSCGNSPDCAHVRATKEAIS